MMFGNQRAHVIDLGILNLQPQAVELNETEEKEKFLRNKCWFYPLRQYPHQH